MNTQQLILSFCIRNNSLFEKIKSKSFYFENETLKVFNLLFSMHEAKKIINPATVIDFYASIQNNQIDYEHFNEIVDYALTGIINDNDFPSLIKECAEKDFKQTLKELDCENLSIPEIQKKISEKSFALDYRVGSKIERISVGLHEALDEKDDSIWSGYSWIDDVLGGWYPEYIIIGARPSQGKTTLLLNFLSPIVKNDIPCGFFSAEMKRRNIARNLLSMETGISSEKIRKKMYSKLDEQKLVAKANMIYEKFKLYIDDTPCIEIEELKYKARKMKEDFGIRLLGIDYVQILKTMLFAKENKLNQITYISGEIKQLQRELDIPVILLSQLTRESDGERPRMSQLKEAGALEQDADRVFLIHNSRNDAYGTDDILDSEIICDKNRNGPTGSMKLKFYKTCGRFVDMKRE